MPEESMPPDLVELGRQACDACSRRDLDSFVSVLGAAAVWDLITRLAAFVAVVILLSGCGGSKPSSAQVRSARSSGAQVRAVVEQYYADLENGKGAAGCGLLTAGARAEIVRPLRLFPGTKLPNGLDCARLMTAYAHAVSSDATALRELRGTKIDEVAMVGDQATVVVTEPHEGLREVPLVKTGDGWLISKLILRVRKPIGG
jgi:hypothetical protein